MGDFHQSGIINTFHNLTQRPLEELEKELEGFSYQRPMTLVLPSLYTELEGPALGPIIENLAQVQYVDELVIGLDRADEKQFQHAQEYFRQLPQRHRILWNDGPRLKAIAELLKEKGLAPIAPGKGRNVWFCFGYVLASDRAKVVALHDCDIVTYERDLLARLLYPVANPSFNYLFCKGYYSRFSQGRLNGRVCRLLVTPLLRSLRQVVGPSEYLDYLDSFHYALAGEFALDVSVLQQLRIPSDWGLEIGVLSEMYRNCAQNTICQVDIAQRYDHKHQDMSAGDAQKGLSRMSTDIAKAIFRKLAIQGTVFNLETFRTVKATYYRTALDFIEAYYNDARMNGLDLDCHLEEETVELFAENIMLAGEHFLSQPMDTPFMPNWKRVQSAIPDILERLREAVEEDNRVC